jgi:hypothetical protein
MQSKHVFATLALLACAPLAAADDLFIECPVGTLDAQVTTALPSGWWSTPQRGNLLGTEVRTVGGQRVLACNYRAFGSSIPVMREQPAGYACAAAKQGFKCTTGKVGQVGGNKATPATQAVSNAKIPIREKADVEVKTQIGVAAPVAKEKTVTPVTQAVTNAPTATKSKAEAKVVTDDKR